MSYREDMANVVKAWRDEIEADLALARQAHERAAGDLREAERQVVALEALLACAQVGQPGTGNTSGTKLTLHQAMRKVLESAPGQMMRAGDIASEIRRRQLYRMQDGRPVEPQQIHARVGHYPKDFTREGTFIKLL